MVAATESDDLVHWTGRHIVYRDEMTGTGAGPTESPFVFEREGRFHLLIGPDWDGLVRSHEQTGSLRPRRLPAHPRHPEQATRCTSTSLTSRP